MAARCCCCCPRSPCSSSPSSSPSSSYYYYVLFFFFFFFFFFFSLLPLPQQQQQTCPGSGRRRWTWTWWRWASWTSAPWSPCPRPSARTCTCSATLSSSGPSARYSPSVHWRSGREERRMALATPWLGRWDGARCVDRVCGGLGTALPPRVWRAGPAAGGFRHFCSVRKRPTGSVMSNFIHVAASHWPCSPPVFGL